MQPGVEHKGTAGNGRAGTGRAATGRAGTGVGSKGCSMGIPKHWAESDGVRRGTHDPSFGNPDHRSCQTPRIKWFYKYGDNVYQLQEAL